MASEELVTEQFQLLGVDLDKEIISKCVSLCEEYNIDAETLVEQWMAFSLTNLGGAPPSIENLDLLVRKEFSKRSVNRLSSAAKETTRSSTGTSLTVYGAPTPAAVQSDNDVLSNYRATTPKRVKVEHESTSNHQNELCPASYSPTVSHSAKYVARTNRGTVVHSYGDEKLLENISKANGPNDILDLNIAQIPNEDGEVYTKPMFGFELLHEKASTFDNHIRYISQCIMKKSGLKEATSVRHKTQNEVVVCGRIECDADARLNPKCVVLQGTWEESLSQAVPVDIDKPVHPIRSDTGTPVARQPISVCVDLRLQKEPDGANTLKCEAKTLLAIGLKQYALFPGQVAAMRGANPRGDRFVAHEVLCDAAPEPPHHAADMMNTLKGTMSIVVASGPYTTSENMAYEPLKDLVTYIGTNRPHVVIMTGPFMDCEHSKIKDNTMAETYKSFFDKLIDSLGEISGTSPYTKIYIVSSPKDAFHLNVYPSPGYSTRRKHPNLHFLPDPSTLNINGIIVGVTSTDVLMHLSQEEISLGMGGDKLARLAGHVLAQQSYYPLWPAPALALDAPLWAAHAQLPGTPHVLLLPSNFRYFVKEVKGCVVVNPEHLAKGTGGGTFARLLVSGDAQEKRVAAQIVRI